MLILLPFGKNTMSRNLFNIPTKLTKVLQGYVIMFDLHCNKQLKKPKGKKDERLSRPLFFLYLDQLSPIALDICLPMQVTESINEHFMNKL